MQHAAIPVFLFCLCATIAAVGLVAIGRLIGPSRSGRVKEMPYESGMNPIHDARRRFDIRFHLVAVAFLLFDVELLFLYPWAVASRNPAGIDATIAKGLLVGGDSLSARGLVLGEVLLFLALLTAGFAYAWRKGVFRWR